MSANFFLLMGRAVGSLFTVRNGQTYSVGDTVPMYDTNPTARNSRAKRVATARCVEDCGTQAKYDFQPFSTPGRSGGALPKINTGDGAYRFRIDQE